MYLPASCLGAGHEALWDHGCRVWLRVANTAEYLTAWRKHNSQTGRESQMMPRHSTNPVCPTPRQSQWTPLIHYGGFGWLHTWG